ncbi:MAG TPA: hypothetical protein VN906_12610 [Candidatus Sulfotelmatobacter sp.]|nr:hypothetical protein [Candidatus Sulfotelmatobacter sp.]
MNWAVLRREWGAVSFVLTVIAGMIVVPLALFFANQGPAAITTPNLTTTSSARASTVQTASPARSPSPSPSHSP